MIRILVKSNTWKVFKIILYESKLCFFFYVLCPIRTLVIMTIHNFLFLLESVVFFLHLSQSLDCTPQTEALHVSYTLFPPVFLDFNLSCVYQILQVLFPHYVPRKNKRFYTDVIWTYAFCCHCLWNVVVLSIFL